MIFDDFDISKDKDGRLRIKYIGKKKSIDKCICIIDPKFSTFHLIAHLMMLNDEYISDL